MQFEESSVLSHGRRTLRPAESNQFKPLANSFPELAFPRIALNAQLACQPHGAEQRDALCVPGLVASPAQPRVKVKATRIVCQSPYYFRIDWYRMSPKFLPKCRRESDRVLSSLSACGVFPVEPESHLVEKVTSTAIPHFCLSKFVLCAEKDRAGEYPPESIMQAPSAAG
jgi:hypothetical protein